MAAADLERRLRFGVRAENGWRRDGKPGSFFLMIMIRTAHSILLTKGAAPKSNGVNRD
jgi:hypothetical protein